MFKPNARAGSDGVCLLVRKDLLNYLRLAYFIDHRRVYYGFLLKIRFQTFVLMYASAICPRMVHHAMLALRSFMIST